MDGTFLLKESGTTIIISIDRLQLIHDASKENQSAHGSASATWAEFEVAVGAAMEMIAHGPGPTFGNLATLFVRISWHSYLQG